MDVTNRSAAVQGLQAVISEKGSSPLHDGSQVQGRVLSQGSDDSYRVSIAGKQLQVRSTLSLTPGQAFTARIQLQGKEIRLILQASPQLESAPSLERLLSALGLPPGDDSARLLHFVQELGIKVQPEVLKKALAVAAALGGGEEKARLSLLLADKGLESGKEAVEALLQGGAGGGSGGQSSGGGKKKKKDDDGDENPGQKTAAGESDTSAVTASEHVATSARTQPAGDRRLPASESPAAAWESITAAPAAFFEGYAASADQAALAALADESRAGALTACNQLYRCRSPEDSSLHWLQLPFEWNFHGYAGIIRLLFDADRKKIQRLSVTMKNNMAQNRFMVYYSAHGPLRAEFSCTPAAGKEKRAALEAAFSKALRLCTKKTIPVAYNDSL